LRPRFWGLGRCVSAWGSLGFALAGGVIFCHDNGCALRPPFSFCKKKMRRARWKRKTLFCLRKRLRRKIPAFSVGRGRSLAISNPAQPATNSSVASGCLTTLPASLSAAAAPVFNAVSANRRSAIKSFLAGHVPAKNSPQSANVRAQRVRCSGLQGGDLKRGPAPSLLH